MNPKIINTLSLPRMKSIWLDEDEDSEKLYNFQSEKFLHNNEEYNKIQISLLNSHRVDENIRLIPVSPNSQPIEKFPNFENELNLSKKNCTLASNKSSVKEKLLSKLKIEWNKLDYYANYRHRQSESKKDLITGPYDFQHIIHADFNSSLMTNDFTKDRNTKTSNETDDNATANTSEPQKLTTFSKAFCTEEIKDDTDTDSDYYEVRNSDTTNLSFDMIC